MLRRSEEKTQVKLLESFFTPGIKKKISEIKGW